MVDVQPVRDEGEELLSLDIYNRVWPWASVTIDEARHFARRALHYGDYLGRVDGEPAGSLVIALLPSRPSVAFALLMVLHEYRLRGVGRALYDAVGVSLGELDVPEVEGPVEEEDAESLAWARRRGLREVERSSRLVLELEGYEPSPQSCPPES